MISGLVPRTRTRALLPSPNKPLPALSAARCGAAAGVWIQTVTRRDRKFAGVFCSSSSSTSRPQASAVEENSGFVGSFYELLGIPEDGSLDEIKQAYKRMALKYHPDVSPPDRAEEYTRHFIELQEAYETLSDPVSRAIYDRDLACGLHLAFSRRRFSEKLEEKSRWRDGWEDQLSGLKRRSMNKGSENLSWAARMRRQSAGSSME